MSKLSNYVPFLTRVHGSLEHAENQMREEVQRAQEKVMSAYEKTVSGGNSFGIDWASMSEGWKSAFARVGFDHTSNQWKDACDVYEYNCFTHQFFVPGQPFMSGKWATFTD